MKNILLILTFLLALSCKAQNPVVSFTDYYKNYQSRVDGVYVKDLEGFFPPYIGTWKWESGNDSFTITISKVAMEYWGDASTKRYEDVLYGDIRYTKNGVEVINPFVGQNLLKISSAIPRNGKFRFSFKDPFKNKYGKVFITLINSNTQIKFHLQNNEGLRVLQPGEIDDPTFSIPRRTDIILTKQ